MEAAASRQAPVVHIESAQAGWPDTPELSLDALFDVVVARNPSLAAMRASWRAAVERYPQVTALDDPRFSYALAPATIGSGSSAFGQRIEVSQRFPWPGKLRLRGDAALSAAAAVGSDVADVRQRLLRSVAEAFYAYQFVHRAIAINGANQDTLGEFQRVAESRYAAGLASKNDVLQAEVERQQLVHRAIALDRERAVARARLNTLLNLAPRSPLPPPPRAVARSIDLQALPLLEEVALANRPDLRALSHLVRARSAAVGVARREYFPDFSINAGYNSLWEDDDKRTLVGIAIDVPLQLGRRRAALSQARAERDLAQSRLEEERARVLLDLSEAYDELRETSRVVQLYRSSTLPVARESVEAARAGYESASNDFLTLIASEKLLYRAELTYEQALARFYQSVARIEYAAGAPLEQLEIKP